MCRSPSVFLSLLDYLPICNMSTPEICTVCVFAIVRLVGGVTSYEGRVEVFHDGQWGTVCDDSWDSTDALVVCRQLRYPGPVTILTGAPYGQGRGNIAMDDVHCTGRESQLKECPFSGWNVHDCLHTEDVSIRCSNPAQYTSQSGWHC